MSLVSCLSATPSKHLDAHRSTLTDLQLGRVPPDEASTIPTRHPSVFDDGVFNTADLISIDPSECALPSVSASLPICGGDS